MKTQRRFAFLLIFLLAAALPSFSEKVATLPAPTGYIDDYAGVLSASVISDMEATARELHDKTRAQVFLVTVNTLEDEPVETFANDLFAKWKIGEKKTDRGILMLFAIKDHKRWIEVGYGFEGILNDAKVGDIGREMVPGLRAQNYDDATQLGFNAICNIIAADSNITLSSLADSPQTAAEPPPTDTAAPESTSHFSLWSLVFPLFWFAFVFILIIRVIWRGRRGIASGGYIGGSTWSDDRSSFSSSDSSSSSSDSGFSGGDGGSSGGGGAGGDW
ncbi:TPM domain-containing protein [Edaphobacter flagellatus]|uniref:TPM domain-containing protein n=1 Tax=Edaphobacter flagellatus TaxID=1933044 RepID=UPI0021B2D02F|nr:TPM domain-containing protein [Edaphobacter flagellatus]